MKTNKYLIILLCILIVTCVSCEEFLDVNQPPGSPGTDAITESVVLPSALARWYGDNKNHMDVVRYWCLQNTNETYSYSTWVLEVDYLVTYPQWNVIQNTLKTSIDLRRLAIENENPNYQGIAEVLMAWSWQNLTDYFGSVPYKEAFKFPEILHPKYDDQEFICSEVVKLLDNAIVNLGDNSSQVKPTADDLVNHGNISQWLKFAYGLKARYAMRLSYAPGKTKSAQAQIAITALGNSLSSNDDNIDFEHYDETGSRGWVYENQKNAPFSYDASIFIIDILKDLNDPRLERIFDPGENGEYYGWKTGVVPDAGKYPSRVSREKYLRPDAPTIFMSYSECKFIEAEAKLYLSDLGGAQDAFEDGIEADMQRMGIDQTSIEDYIATLTLPSDEESALEMIINQKYLANFMGTTEVLFDHIRTGFPKFDYIANMVGVGNRTIPRKLPPPELETQTNDNTPAYTGTPTSGANRVWWDTKPID